MVITKHEDITKQGFCKTLWKKLRLQGSLFLVIIQFFGEGVGGEMGWGGSGRLFKSDLEWEGGGLGVGAY